MVGVAPTQFPAGGKHRSNWLDPNFRDPLSVKLRSGFSHSFLRV